MLRNNPDYAVQFGRSVDMGLGPQKAFPFFYNFVPSDKDNWDLVKGGGSAANLQGIGPQVGPNATIDHVINLDADSNFTLLSLKYTVYHIPELALAGYRWYDIIPAGWFQEQFDYQTSYGTPLSRYIEISISFIGPDGRYLYGGQNLDAVTNNRGGLLPLPIEVSQGYDFGYGQLRTPYLLPTNGSVMVKITNTHTVKTLVVGGILQGMKVRI